MGPHMCSHISDYGCEVNLLFFRGSIYCKGKWKVRLAKKDLLSLKGPRLGGIAPCACGVVWAVKSWTPVCCGLTGDGLSDRWPVLLHHSLISMANSNKVTVVDKSK